jgi:hypothetical protein
VTRYIIACDDKYVAACQPNTRIISLTYSKDDAGSWLTYERAVEAARVVADWNGAPVAIHVVEEPNYPKSWTSIGRTTK